MKLQQIELVLKALGSNRIMAQDSIGNYTKEITPRITLEAILIMEAERESQTCREKAIESASAKMTGPYVQTGTSYGIKEQVIFSKD